MGGDYMFDEIAKLILSMEELLEEAKHEGSALVKYYAGQVAGARAVLTIVQHHQR
jgi:hypothetical protein